MKQPIGAGEWNGRKAPNDEVFVSASTVASKVLANPVLENWTVEATAKWVIENMGQPRSHGDHRPRRSVPASEERTV